METHQLIESTNRSFHNYLTNDSDPGAAAIGIRLKNNVEAHNLTV